MEQLQKDKLAKQIAEADLPTTERELLLRRLKVASHEGVAAVIRDFEQAMTIRRAQVSPSYRRRLGMMDFGSNKMAHAFATK